MPNLILFFLIILLTFSLPVQAEDLMSRLPLRFKYEIWGMSQFGPLPELAKGNWQAAQIPAGEKEIYLFSQSKTEGQIPLIWSTSLVFTSRQGRKAITNPDTANFLRELVTIGQDFPATGSFYLLYQEWQAQGPGLSLELNLGNLTMEGKAFLLHLGKFYSRSFSGEIIAGGARGYYDIRYGGLTLNADSPGDGFTSDIHLELGDGGKKLSLTVENLGGYLQWDDLLFRTGEFRFRDYDYSEEGGRIVPPMMKGVYFHSPQLINLPLRFNLTAGLEYGPGELTFSFEFPDPALFRLHYPIIEGLQAVFILPRPVLGLAFSRGGLKTTLWSSSLNPFQADSLGLQFSIEHSF